jgi:predicted Zn-dependent peptidase
MEQVLTFGIDKIGDNQAIKFFIETIDDEYTLNGEKLLNEALDLVLDVAFNPDMTDDNFKEEYIETEKENLRKVIESKIDNKDFYAFNRAIENMHSQEGFGLYKYGYLEDLEKITNEEISKYYHEMISKVKIDIYISGNFEEEKINEFLKENEILKNLNPRKENYIMNFVSTDCTKKVDNPSEIQEKMDIKQGKLVMGYKVHSNLENLMTAGTVFNSILGDGANSMLFQNVREKAGLAYTTRSTFNKIKYDLFIRCGIEISNYKKTVDLIKEQLENITLGKFTNSDIMNAKNYIISSIKSIEAEQDTQIVFYIGQEITKKRNTVKEYIEKIESVTKEQIVEFAKSLELKIIYFLTGNGAESLSSDLENDSNDIEDEI